MKPRIAAALIALATITQVGTAWAGSSSGTPITIRLISGSPHTVVPIFHRKTGTWSNCSVTLRVKVSGVKLEGSIHRNDGAAKPGEGNIQFFADSIPGAAYRTSHIPAHWLAAELASRVVLCLAPVLFGGKFGNHTLLIAVGKTNGILYGHVKPAVFRFDLKRN